MIQVQIRSRETGWDYRPYYRWPSIEAVLADLQPDAAFVQAQGIIAVGDPMHYPEFFTLDVERRTEAGEEAVTLLVPK